MATKKRKKTHNYSGNSVRWKVEGDLALFFSRKEKYELPWNRFTQKKCKMKKKLKLFQDGQVMAISKKIKSA